ncbi:hypothetical protein [Lysinibacillus xylanilyticus]|uniref:hypothetical protein n=1 Tax=Lysinibacillus xylanilyticus TaxID=582475 RepID=UPI0036DD9F32
MKFFTPTVQVELCVHATIASFRALLDSCAIEDNNTSGSSDAPKEALHCANPSVSGKCFL